MDIERLKELKDYLRVANELSILNDDNLMQRIVKSNDVTNTIDIAIELLNAEIARQSVKSEDVQEAIGDLLDMKEHWCADSTDNDAISIDLAITALQAYQPTIRKNRTVEEVAISKTETTSCEWCEGNVV